MLDKEIIMLYHGGSSWNIDSIKAYGLSAQRPFYCTPSYSLALNASDGVPDSVLEIELLKERYDYAVAKGLFEVRPYCGLLCDFWEIEIVVSVPGGIEILNDAIPRYRKY